MLTFYHCPYSRSSSIFWLLEELAIPYEMEVIDVRAPDGVAENYRKIQPSKKVPAIVHDGEIVTERAAIALYLADAFPAAALAPAIGDKSRAAYLTMLVYCDAVLDPAIGARAHGLTYTSRDYSFGLFDDMVNYLEEVLSSRPYAAGDRFTAADTQIASAIAFTMGIMKLLPEKPAFVDYLNRVTARAAYRKVMAIDAELMKSVTPLPNCQK